MRGAARVGAAVRESGCFRKVGTKQMPQFLVFAVAAAAAYAGWKFVRREMNRVEAKLDAVRREGEAVGRAAVPTLERDPATGVFRPRDPA